MVLCSRENCYWPKCFGDYFWFLFWRSLVDGAPSVSSTCTRGSWFGVISRARSRAGQCLRWMTSFQRARVRTPSGLDFILFCLKTRAFPPCLPSAPLSSSFWSLSLVVLFRSETWLFKLPTVVLCSLLSLLPPAGALSYEDLHFSISTCAVTLRFWGSSIWAASFFPVQPVQSLPVPLAKVRGGFCETVLLDPIVYSSH